MSKKKIHWMISTHTLLIVSPLMTDLRQL